MTSLTMSDNWYAQVCVCVYDKYSEDALQSAVEEMDFEDAMSLVQ